MTNNEINTKGEKLMNPKLKGLRHRINDYFGDTTYHIHFYTFPDGTIIDIVYEGPQNEMHVTQAIKEIVGDTYLLNIKRECTDELLEEIEQHYGHTTNRKELYQEVSEYEDVKT